MTTHGILYLVATPIGNLKDVTLRALEVLDQAHVICAEDTRITRRLLDAHQIRPTELWSLHQHNEAKQIESVLGRLQQGHHIALISDAGTPLVSDPGFPLVRAAIDAQIRVEPIPGPCAAIAAITASGLPPEPFTFVGFPPKSTARARTWIKERLRPPGTYALYVPARDAEQVCGLIAEHWPQAPVVVGREITKIHETFHRATAQTLSLPDEARRGEATLVVYLQPQEATASTDAEIQDRISALLDRGLSKRDAVSAVSILLDHKRSHVQKIAHELDT